MSYRQAVEMGALAGLRSMAAPAMVSEHLSRDEGARGRESPLPFLAAPGVALGLKVLAAGEMVADKTPWIPDRTSPFPLAGRGVMGALVGAALSSGEGLRPEVGAALGGASAVAAAHAAYQLRRRLGEATRLPDPLLGAIEDLVVVACGLQVLRRRE
jgi:uncharacterized membrane protein